jgi:hypothetical protein
MTFSTKMDSQIGFISLTEVTYVEGLEQIISTPVSVQDLSRQSYSYFFSSPERSTYFTPSQQVATEHISIVTSMKPKNLHGGRVVATPH